VKKKSCRYLLSYSPGGSKRREVGPTDAFWTPFWGKKRSYGVSDGAIRKSDGSFL